MIFYSMGGAGVAALDAKWQFFVCPMKVFSHKETATQFQLSYGPNSRPSTHNIFITKLMGWQR